MSRRNIIIITITTGLFVILFVSVLFQPQDDSEDTPLPSATPFVITVPDEQIRSTLLIPLEDINQPELTSSGEIVALNDSRELVSVNTEGDITQIYREPIFEYKTQGQWSVFTDLNNTNIIGLYNSSEDTLNIIDAGDYSQIFSASLSLDNQSIFFIGDFDPFERTAYLYKTPINSFSPERLFPAIGSNIAELSGNRIAMLQSADSEDDGRLLVYNLNTGRNIFSRPGDELIASPTGRRALVRHKNNIYILNEQNATFAVPTQAALNSMIWKDDNILLIAESRGDNQLAILEVETSFMTTQKEQLVNVTNGTDIIRLISYVAGTLFAETSSGALISIPIE